MKMQVWRSALGLGLVTTALLSIAACGQTPAEATSSAPTRNSIVRTDAPSASESVGTGTLESTDPTTSVMIRTTSAATAAGKTTTVQTGPSAAKPSSKWSNLTRDQVMAKMPAKLKGTTIKYMSWDDPRQAMEKTAIAEFEKKTGIKLEVEMVDLTKKYDVLASRVASGNPPDVFRTDEVWPSVCKNLQPIQNLGYDFNDKAWDWDLMGYSTYNGRTYTMQLKDTPFTPVAVLYYNKAALRKAEMDDMDPYTIWKNDSAAWTWDKFFSLCDTFVNRNGGKDGYYGAIFGDTYIYAYPRCFGLANMDYDPKAGRFVSNVSNPAFISRMETLADAVQKKWISNTAEGFEMGQVLFAWNWAINAQADNIYYANLKKRNNLGIVPIPTDSTKQVLYQHYAHGVPVGAKNAGAVPYFLRYIQDRKGYDIETIYSVPHSAEVTEWSIEQGRKKNNFFVGGGINNYYFISKILISPAAQVKSICDTYAPEFEAAAKSANEAMTALPQ